MIKNHLKIQKIIIITRIIIIIIKILKFKIKIRAVYTMVWNKNQILSMMISRELIQQFRILISCKWKIFETIVILKKQ